MTMTSRPRWRFSRRARAASCAIEMPPVWSMNSGIFCMVCEQATSFSKSVSVISPRLILEEGISVCSEMMRVASCSDDISSEKKPMTPPFLALNEPSACCAGS